MAVSLKENNRIFLLRVKLYVLHLVLLSPFCDDHFFGEKNGARKIGNFIAMGPLRASRTRWSPLALCRSAASKRACMYIERAWTIATRLGEFSTIGPLFSLGSFLKIKEGAEIFGLLFCHRKSYLHINFDKTRWSYTLVDFFHKLTLSHWPRLKPIAWCALRLQNFSFFLSVSPSVYVPFRPFLSISLSFTSPLSFSLSTYLDLSQLWLPWRLHVCSRRASSHM
jgi:hypothetical protein